MPMQAVACFAIGHGLGAGGAFRSASAKVQDGLSPMADTLLRKDVDRIDLHALRTPAESAVGRRVAAPDDVDPKRFFDDWFEQTGVDVEVVLLGAFPHPVERAFNHIYNGGNLDAGVRA